MKAETCLERLAQTPYFAAKPKERIGRKGRQDLEGVDNSESESGF